MHVLRLALTPSRSAFSSEGAGWVQHDPFAAVKLLLGLPLVSRWWRTVVATHERALWRCVAAHLRATIPRHYQEPPRLTELVMCPVFVPSVQPSTAELEYGAVRKLCAPVTSRAKRSRRAPVSVPAVTATTDEEDWRASVRRCVQAVRRFSSATCEDGERAVKVNGEMTDLWGDFVITHNVRMFGVYQVSSSGTELKRCFQMRGGTGIISIFATLRPSSAHGVQMLCVILTDEGQLVLNVLDLKSGRLELMVTLKTSIFIIRGLQMSGFLTASNRWLGVHTDQAQVALWDLALTDEALGSKSTQSEDKRLELDASVEVDARFYAVHPSRDALALASSNFVGIYDIATTLDDKARLRLVATVDLARCHIACLAFNSRLVAVIEHEQPHIQLVDSDHSRPTPLAVTKISSLLPPETTTISTLRCMALDDRRLYFYHHHGQRGSVRIFNVSLAWPGLQSHTKEAYSLPRARLAADAICGDRLSGDSTRHGRGLLFELEARLLVGPSLICVQPGSTNDLCLFPLQGSTSKPAALALDNYT